MSITIINVETLNVKTLNVHNNTSVPSTVYNQCNQNKPLTGYNKDKRKSDGLRCNCKSCQSITNKLLQD